MYSERKRESGVLSYCILRQKSDYPLSGHSGCLNKGELIFPLYQSTGQHIAQFTSFGIFSIVS